MALRLSLAPQAADHLQISIGHLYIPVTNLCWAPPFRKNGAVNFPSSSPVEFAGMMPHAEALLLIFFMNVTGTMFSQMNIFVTD